MESIRFKALRVVSETEVELTFEGDDGTPVAYRVWLKPAGLRDAPDDPLLFTCDADFWWTHRYFASPDEPRWPQELAAQALRAAKHTFPAGETRERLLEEIRAARKAAWDATH